MSDAKPADVPGRATPMHGAAPSRCGLLPRLRAAMLVVVTAAAMVAGCAATGGTRGEAGRATVLVAGATGGTGQAVVEQALARGYRVRALVRDEAKGRALFGDRVGYAVGDVRDPGTLGPALKGVDYVISALGSNTARDPENSPELVDYGGVKSLAESARAAGVRHFVLVSSMGVTQPDHQLNRILNDILKWKLRGEQALRATGMNYTIVRPGGLTNDPGARGGVRVMQGDPPDVAGRIPRADLATILVNALGLEQAYGKTLEVVGGEGSMDLDWRALFASLKPDILPE